MSKRKIDNLFQSLTFCRSAFKFLPVLGRYVADVFDSTASQEQKDKWSWKGTAAPILKGDGSRGGPPRRLLTKAEQARL